MPSRSTAQAVVRTRIHARVDIGQLLPPSVPMNAALRKQLTSTRRSIDRFARHLAGLSKKIESLEGEGKLENFEIQDLMAGFNEAERLASNVLKKRDDTANAVIGKV